MGVIFDHRDPGTAEAAWRDAAPWRDAEPLRLDVDEVVVLAAHPDDETLGAGGLIAQCARRGIPVSVVVVTDGDASRDGTDLARVRRSETVDAVHELAPGADVRFLGFRDGTVREERARIAARLESALPHDPAARTLLVAPWAGDGHRDHRVLGEIAGSFARPGTRVVGYPIWLWHWGDPAATDAAGWRTLDLETAVHEAKSRAIARHRSQLETPADAADPEPVLHAGMRAHFTRPFEVFIEASAPASVSVDTAYFDDLFARHDDPWGFASRWYEIRKRDILLAALPAARYDAALELGCATGEVTARLAARAERVIAVDAASRAVERAARRCAEHANVEVRRAQLPEETPDGRFDLIVVSELLYYLGDADRARLIAQLRDRLCDDGIVVACHWRHPIGDAAADGDGVHAELRRALGLRVALSHVEDDFLLDVFAPQAQGSVAQREGLV